MADETFEFTRAEIELLLSVVQDIRRTVIDACPEEVSERVGVEVERLHREIRMPLMHKLGSFKYADERDDPASST